MVSINNIQDIRNYLEGRSSYRYYILAKISGLRVVIDTENFTYSYRLGSKLYLPEKDVVFLGGFTANFHRRFDWHKPIGVKDRFIPPSEYYMEGSRSHIYAAVLYKNKHYEMSVIYVNWFRELYKYNPNLLTAYLSTGETYIYDKPILDILYRGSVELNYTWRNLFD